VVIAIASLIGVTFMQPFTVAVNPDTVVYAYGGGVTLSLPPGGSVLANRPTVLKIEFWHTYNGQGEFFGPGDVMRIWLWVPANNAFVAVALIQNNQNASLQPWFAKLLNGTALGQNVVTVNPDQLMITKVERNVLRVNLTTAVNIAIGDPLPVALKALNFTLPPLVMEVRGFDSPFSDQAVTNLPSGYNVTATTINLPAWVRVWMPQWLGASWWTSDGVEMLRMVVNYYAP